MRLVIDDEVLDEFDDAIDVIPLAMAEDPWTLPGVLKGELRKPPDSRWLAASVNSSLLYMPDAMAHWECWLVAGGRLAAVDRVGIRISLLAPDAAYDNKHSGHPLKHCNAMPFHLTWTICIPLMQETRCSRATPYSLSTGRLSLLTKVEL